MHITFVLDPQRISLWQAEAIGHALKHPGWSGSILFRAGPKRPTGLDLVYRLEEMIYGLPEDRPLAPVERESLAHLPDITSRPDLKADLMVDLVGTGPVRNSLRLTCARQPVELGAADAILAGTTPILTLTAFADGEGTDLADWPIGVEAPDVLARGVGTVLGRALQLIDLALEQVANGTAARDIALPSGMGAVRVHARAPLGLFLGALSRRITARLLKRSQERARWMTGWRVNETAANALPVIKGGRFHLLPDDGKRFYADPFPVTWQGRSFLFVEDYPYATGRGVISAVELGPDGPVGTPEPVLEQACHLSYPFLFEHQDTLYMVPETSGRRSVELWRAIEFPGRWEQVATLIDDIDLGDATLVERADGWYLLGAVRERWCSSWDALEVWQAPSLLGPWRRVGPGPVMVDVHTARPAGRVLTIGGRLLRPFQSSSGGYGAAMGFAEIDRMDASGYGETVKIRLNPAAPLKGLHTYNRSAGFEAIDVFGTGKPDPIAP
ncbi:glucosamine inositolphosphorylceramide transferase family protein [Oryzibacter oryziterrae]|uniref:glucosamine inositolphosphorylceramide transferase family protein n=1 Tax=Oryzibacter oryziterrae TaxID=2766474 RepID=UPI001F163985|nr:hypothetical protein [Oryzibacter oryziterrae]